MKHCLHSRRSTETEIRDNLFLEELFISTTSVARLILSLGSVSDIPLKTPTESWGRGGG